MTHASFYDALVIGAGPAGLFCALSAAKRGRRVLVADRQAAGRKLALAGGGKGNITNRILDPRHYISENPAACARALRGFGTNDALELLASFRIPWEERDFGQIFCLRRAEAFASALEAACREAGVDFALGDAVSTIRYAEGDFSAKCGAGLAHASRLVLATGSPAYPQIGASDFGGALAGRWGHRLVPFRPALTPFLLPAESPLLGLEGISLNVRVSVLSGGQVHTDPAGVRPLLFTHKGLSGPAALVASCFWRPGDELLLDLLPEISVTDLLHDPAHGKLLGKNLLARHLPSRLAERLCPPDVASRKTAELGKADRLRLAEALHKHRVTPSGLEGFRKAEAAAGGVAMDQLTDDLESRLVPGLFFCGEILDMTGLLGGYNIHWALASSHLVGKTL